MPPRKPPIPLTDDDDDPRTTTLEGTLHAELRGRLRDIDLARQFRQRNWKLIRTVGGYFAAMVAALLALREFLAGWLSP